MRKIKNVCSYLVNILNTVAMWQVDMCQIASQSATFAFYADELLQEQKADMDQFLSSISESQPDVTVSLSEESVEVPVSEGKPYRPFQVTSLGSHSEPEGEELRHSLQAASRATPWLLMRTIALTERSS